MEAESLIITFQFLSVLNLNLKTKGVILPDKHTRTTLTMSLDLKTVHRFLAQKLLRSNYL